MVFEITNWCCNIYWILYQKPLCVPLASVAKTSLCCLSSILSIDISLNTSLYKSRHGPWIYKAFFFFKLHFLIILFLIRPCKFKLFINLLKIYKNFVSYLLIISIFFLQSVPSNFLQFWMFFCCFSFGFLFLFFPVFFLFGCRVVVSYCFTYFDD